MSSVKIELNTQGVRELLKSQELASGIHNLAENIVGNEQGYVIKDIDAPTRVISTIQIVTEKKMQENLDTNELIQKVTE